MSAITVISASNREDNRSQVFAELCAELLENQGVETQVYSLQNMPDVLSGLGMYDYENSPINEIVEKYLQPVNKVVFVIPEYNGSFPGILKLFIDAIQPRNFNFKKAALVGISSGRAGNVRGMDHLASILNYIKVDVYHHKLPIASIDRLIDGNRIQDQVTIDRINALMKDFLKF